MRKVDKPLILYGKGKLGKLAAEIFDKLDIKYTMMDKHDRYPPVGHDALVAVCVATESYNTLVSYLRKMGWEDIVPVWDIVAAYPEMEIDIGWNISEIVAEVAFSVADVAAHWEDGWSWYHYAAFGHWRISRVEDAFYGWCPVIYNRFNTPEVVNALGGNESFYTENPGATLQDIIARRRHIPDLHGYTYIELHLEGNELPALEINIANIQRYRPILCVTLYHNPDGFVKIPHFLMTNLRNYRFYFRLHSYMGTGAVMYCIPKER